MVGGRPSIHKGTNPQGKRKAIDVNTENIEAPIGNF